MSIHNATRRLAATWLICASLAGAAAVAAQEPTATPLPVKATLPAPSEITPEETPQVEIEATPEALAETPLGDLSYNTPVIGRIGGTTIEQDWPLPLTSADRVTIEVTRLDGNLLPDIFLLDANGDQIGSSYGPEDDGATALLENITLNEAGDYTVRVSRERGADGLTEGFYQLTVIPLAVGLEAEANSGIVGEIEIDEPVEGTLTAEHWYHRYTLNATAADTIRVVAERTGGSLEPLVHVLSADGSILTTGYTQNTGDIASTNRVDLSDAGEYTIVVTRASEFSGNTLGSYRLTVELIGSGEGSPNLAGTAGDVVYGEALEGAITPARWYEDWTLTAEAGDTIRIHVQRADDANLQPEVMLLGGSGQELTRGYTENTGDHASIDRRTLDGPGEYTVRVSRRGGQTGETTGAYTLVVELIGSGEGSAALQGTTGAVAVGDTVKGEVTNERWADSWSFSADEDEPVEIVVERASGTLIPRLQIRDRNGQPLSDAYPEPTRDRAIRQFYPPSSGEFLIVVMRDREQEGVTSGEYSLTVRPLDS